MSDINSEALNVKLIPPFGVYGGSLRCDGSSSIDGGQYAREGRPVQDYPEPYVFRNGAPLFGHCDSAMATGKRSGAGYIINRLVGGMSRAMWKNEHRYCLP